ncbi:Periplasmic protein refolding chaperone Spy/CpxP family [Marinomonas fungiae]|uniref:Periplasmic protein refolding chaperone Spy/CpxP family n=2 Tax=Marinomonas fungiae TaxID=1137284 RepID=A0A0K6IIP3_9GAMM|nr:Periplasmic protein refolding chaperone Spy/CpxP family [Marinomonas fungiae]
MNMNKKLIAAALALPLFLGSAAYADGHQGDKGSHAKKGHGACGDESALMAELNLTDEQKSEVKALRQANREQMKAYFEQHGEGMMAERQKQQADMQKLVMADSFDEKAAQKLADGKAQKQASMMVKKLQAEHQMVSLLSAEQKVKYAKLKQEQKQACQDEHGKKRHGKN